MANILAGVPQYIARFGESSIACNPYAMSKLGIDRAGCLIKVEEHAILCAPFQLGFKRFIFMASLSVQELGFFQKFVNNNVGLSISFQPDKRPKPAKFFIRCTLNTIGQMKGRDNVGLFVLDFKTCPDEMISIFGHFLEAQEKTRTAYEDYGSRAIRMTPDVAKIMGYNLYATIVGPNPDVRRVQVFSISSKAVEHLEAEGAPARLAGTMVNYQFFFKKYRVSTTGTIVESSILPQGLVRTRSNLDFCPELVEIIDDYWHYQSSQ